MSEIWEEIDSLTVLPTLTVITPEITAFLTAIDALKEESRLFQFLNGLNDVYIPLRSQLLMRQPLPSVEMACSVIQQEESQKDVLKISKLNVDYDMSAMYSQGNVQKSQFECTVCHGKGHTADMCWTVINYPKWHLKSKTEPQCGVSTQNWSTNHSGSTKMSNNAQNGLLLKDLLYVPTFKHNLISVHKLSQDNACHVQFSLAVCEILRNQDNIVVATGHLDHGLYYLDDAQDVPVVVDCTTPATIALSVFTDFSFQLWHNRLGHASLSTMNHNPELSKFAKDGNQKGYKLMNSVTKQTFVTRDARFYEGIFPFNSNSTKPYIQPLPVDVPHVQPGYVDCDDFLVESIVPVDLDTSSHVDTSHQSNPPDINLRRSTM
ncbi:hypothetical protein AgCh_011483 [Apium graveolens]